MSEANCDNRSVASTIVVEPGNLVVAT